MKAFFFDMDGVLFDSMPYHAIAWSEVMTAHGLPFTPEDAYRCEGRTGRSVILELSQKVGRTISDEDIQAIYAEKSDRFQQLNDGHPIPGVLDVLRFLSDTNRPGHLHGEQIQIWIVTGSGQLSLFDRLETIFPGIFSPERMITAYDVKRGKPDPEPYLMAWERSGLSKEDCFIVENAPLGVRAGRAAGIVTYAVNTGPLPDSDLRCEGANYVFKNMSDLLAHISL